MRQDHFRRRLIPAARRLLAGRDALHRGLLSPAGPVASAASVEQGPGGFWFGEQQNRAADPDERKRHRSGTISDQPAVLMTVQPHVEPRRQSRHMR